MELTVFEWVQALIIFVGWVAVAYFYGKRG